MGHLFLNQNHLENLALPADLTQLAFLDLTTNQLTNLTLPSGLTNLSTLILDANPLTTFVLSESSAATTLAELVASLSNQGVSVFTFPLTIQLSSPRQTVGGAFELTLLGSPGVYAILGSADLATWSQLGLATNNLGSVVFTDVRANLSPTKFYRAHQ